MKKNYLLCTLVAIASFVAGWSLSPTKVENKLIDSFGFEWTEEDIIHGRKWSNELLEVTYICKCILDSTKWTMIKGTDAYMEFRFLSEEAGEPVECYGLE